MAPVINVFKKDNNSFETLVAVTAQNREMLDQVLFLFEIIPDYDLDLMCPNQSLESLTCKIITGITELLIKIKPDIVFVQGDTTTTFSSSLASFYQKIPVAHIEAGLRTKNIYSPFPEEINRRMTSIIASFHFPPTDHAKQNLLNEGVKKENIKLTGNTVIDALITVSRKIDIDSKRHEDYFLNNYGISFNGRKTILITGHRRESFGKGFVNICNSIKSISKKYDVQIIYPVHLNPNVQEPVMRILGDVKDIYLIPPQDYVPFVFLMKNAYIILSDSGGVQEEAPSLGKPVLVMRETTERPEGVEAGTSKLVGTDPNTIISTVKSLLNDKLNYDKMACPVNPYGDGKASQYIYDFIKNRL